MNMQAGIGVPIGKCKYCQKFSEVSMMMKDENNRPYHQGCKNLEDSKVQVQNMVDTTEETN